MIALGKVPVSPPIAGSSLVEKKSLTSSDTFDDGAMIKSIGEEMSWRSIPEAARSTTTPVVRFCPELIDPVRNRE